jgi:hypothetical protein
LIFWLQFKLEEAEWIGLKPWEATTKLKKILEAEEIKNIKPLKEKYREETLAKFESDPSSIDNIIESSNDDTQNRFENYIKIQ